MMGLGGLLPVLPNVCPAQSVSVTVSSLFLGVPVCALWIALLTQEGHQSATT